MKWEEKAKYCLEISTRIDKGLCRLSSVDGIIDGLRGKIESHRSGRFIGVFDIREQLRPQDHDEQRKPQCKNLLFCLSELSQATPTATRPCAISVCEMETSFTITYLAVAQPWANDAMKQWIEEVVTG